MNERANLHNPRVGSVGSFGGWHADCSCGEFKATRLDSAAKAHFAVYYHLLRFDTECAHRYWLDNGLAEFGPLFENQAWAAQTLPDHPDFSA